MPKSRNKPKTQETNSRGPKAETLKIDGDWKAAVKKSLEKKPTKKK